MPGAEYVTVASFEQANRPKATKSCCGSDQLSAGYLPERDLQSFTMPALKGERQKPELAKRKCLKEGRNITYPPSHSSWAWMSSRRLLEMDCQPEPHCVSLSGQQCSPHSQTHCSLCIRDGTSSLQSMAKSLLCSALTSLLHASGTLSFPPWQHPPAVSAPRSP